MEQQSLRQYPCEVREVFSGDDLVIMADLGVEGLWKRQRVRLLGVDTPNAVNASEDTDAGKIRKMVRTLAKNRRGIFTISSVNLNSWVGTLVVESQTTPGGVLNLNEYLIQQGYVFKRAGV